MAIAAEHQKEGRLEEAERLYRRVLRENPRNVDALRLLAQIATGADHAGRCRSACCRKPSASRPTSCSPCSTSANCSRNRTAYAEAIDCFDRVDRARADQAPGALSARGHAGARIVHARGSHGLPALPRNLRPSHAGALLGLGHVLNTLGDYDGAVASYDACMRLSAGLRRDLLEPRQPQDLPLRRRDDRSDGASRCCAGSANRSRGSTSCSPSPRPGRTAATSSAPATFYRRGNERQRAEVHYDPVQTEVMNDRTPGGLYGGIARVAARRREPEPVADLHPRPAALGLDAARAGAREPFSLVEGTAELPYVGRLATSLNRNRAGGVNYPEAMRELRRAKLRGARHAVPCAREDAPPHRARRASSTRCRTISRTSGLIALDAPEREGHRRAPPPARRLPVLLAAVVRERARTSPTT